MTPIVYQTQQSLDGAALPHHLPWQCFTMGWYGQPLEFEAAFQLIQDSTTLYFSARCDLPSPAEPEQAPGAFLKELWKGDVAEVFVRDPHAAALYQEWNLSPVGAWWTQGFADVREPAADFTPPSGVRTWFRSHRDSGWLATLAIPRSWEVLNDCGLNVTMILSAPKQERTFLSCVPDTDNAPDLHVPARYPKPEIRPCFPEEAAEL